ncbi:DUF6941 family protein [Haloechinothrix aidingensis]|uniref:DUF6941 family protein n=1 Tax=Haloechinothrix aidingensis TaxID=2752311 RepID=UPI003CCE3FF0
MASPLDVKLILCDHAVTDSSSKVHMLGAGWDVTSTPTKPHGVAVLLKVPWDRANQQIPLTLDLIDADGNPANTGSSDPIRVEGEVEVGRPPGMAPGSMIPAAFTVNVGPLKLAPGRYDWRLTIGDEHHHAEFQVVDKSGRSPR